MNEGMDKEIREALHAKIVFPGEYRRAKPNFFSPGRNVSGRELLGIIERMKYYRTPNSIFVSVNETILTKNIVPNETYPIPRNTSEWEELFIALLYKEFVINKFGDLCE